MLARAADKSPRYVLCSFNSNLSCNPFTTSDLNIIMSFFGFPAPSLRRDCRGRIDGHRKHSFECNRVRDPCCHLDRSQHMSCSTIKIFGQDEETFASSIFGTCLASLPVLHFLRNILLSVRVDVIFSAATYPRLRFRRPE